MTTLIAYEVWKKENKMTKLTDNFSLAELTQSITAANRGIDNTPTAVVIMNLRALAQKVLQPAREHLGAPITVSSGYRSPKLNKVIGGAKHSQHKLGEAADIICENNGLVFNFIMNHLEFDQLIWEFGNEQQPQWIHVSFSRTQNRGEVLRAFKENSKTVYEPL